MRSLVDDNDTAKYNDGCGRTDGGGDRQSGALGVWLSFVMWQALGCKFAIFVTTLTPK